MPDPICRLLSEADFEDAVSLYTELNGDSSIPLGDEGREQWGMLLSHPGTSIIGVELGGAIVAMVTLHLMPNMTYDARPYALIENVISSGKVRGKGFGKLVMQAAIDRAWEANAYKIMLLTGKERGASGFYKSLGFNDEDKNGMVMWRM